MAVPTYIKPSALARSRVLPLGQLTIFWAILQIALGLTFRTFDTSVSPNSMEFFRQTGIVVLVAQLLFCASLATTASPVKAVWQRFDPFTKLMLAVLLSSIWIGAGFYSPSPMFSITLNVVLCIQLLFGVTVYDRLDRVDEAEIGKMRWILIGGMAVFVLMIAQYFAQVWQENRTGVWQFAIPGYISVRLFGAVCGAVSAFTLARLLTDIENGKVKWFHYGAFTFILTLTLWTGTRAAVMGVGGALLINWLYFSLKPGSPAIMKLGLCALVAYALATALLPPDPVFRLFHSGDYASVETASAGRLEYWRLTWQTFLTAPVFGIGFGATFWTMPPNVWPHVQPHNVVLQYLVNWGLVGAIPAFYLLGRAVWRAHQIVMVQRHLLPVIAMLNCLLLMSLVDGVLHFARETMMVIMCFAIIFRAGENRVPH